MLTAHSGWLALIQRLRGNYGHVTVSPRPRRSLRGDSRRALQCASLRCRKRPPPVGCIPECCFIRCIDVGVAAYRTRCVVYCRCCRRLQPRRVRHLSSCHLCEQPAPLGCRPLVENEGRPKYCRRRIVAAPLCVAKRCSRNLRSRKDVSSERHVFINYTYTGPGNVTF